MKQIKIVFIILIINLANHSIQNSILNQNYNTTDQLIFFASQGNNTQVKKILKKGLDVNSKDCEGNTALHFAALNGECKVINTLLNLGANINEQNNAHQTPLMLAVIQTRRCAIKNLLERGANINLQDQNGNSAIMLATLIDHPKPSTDITKILLNKKYNPNLTLKNNCRDTAITLASSSDKYYLVDTILCYLKNNLSKSEITKILNQRNCYKSTALAISIENFNNCISFDLIDAGADIEKSNKFGNSPLMLAVLERNFTLVDKLLCLNANINHQNNFGYTPLMFAITREYEKLAEQLVLADANLELKNNKGLSAIELACKCKNNEIARTINRIIKNRNSKNAKANCCLHGMDCCFLCCK